MKGFIEVRKIIAEHTVETISIRVSLISQFYEYFSTKYEFNGTHFICKIVFNEKEIDVANDYKEIKKKIEEAQ